MAHNNAINAESTKRRFALLFTAGYGKRYTMVRSIVGVGLGEETVQ